MAPRRPMGEHPASMLRPALPLLIALAAALCAALSACSGAAEPPPPAPDGALRIVSFNAAYVRESKVERWRRRAPAFAEALTALNPDLIAFQEMETFTGGHKSGLNRQLDAALAALPGHAAAASGDPDVFPWTQPILYRTARLEALDQGFFFLSDTPDTIYAPGFAGGFPFFCSWARFRDRDSGRAFTAFNVHVDVNSGAARDKSVALILDRMAQITGPGEPVILLGDFNALPGFPSVRAFQDAGLELTPASGPTYHFNMGLNLIPGPIDHIFLGEGLARAGAPFVLRGRFGGVLPSDHYPVGQDVRLTAGASEGATSEGPSG